MRVVPRDLFNEGKLLTEMGFLTLYLHENKNGIANVLELKEDCMDEPFEIQQNPDDGSIHIANLPIYIKGIDREIYFYRPVNSRAKNSLKFQSEEWGGDVFENDNFSDDFINFIAQYSEG